MFSFFHMKCWKQPHIRKNSKNVSERWLMVDIFFSLFFLRVIRLKRFSWKPNFKNLIFIIFWRLFLSRSHFPLSPLSEMCNSARLTKKSHAMFIDHDHSEYEVYITFIFFSRFFQRSIIYLSSSITYTALTSETDKLAATPSLIPKCCPQNNSTLEFSWWGLTQNSPLVLSTLIFQSWLRYREHFPIPVLWILIRSLLFSGICALIFLWFIGHACRYGSWARVPKI